MLELSSSRAVKTITSEALRWNLTRVAKDATNGNRVLVTFRGKPRFAIVPLADLERIEGKPATAKTTKRRAK